MSAAAGAAVYLAASEIGKDKLKMTGLFVLASASMAGMVTAKASAKAYSAHQRIDTLVPIIHTASTNAAVGANFVSGGGTVGGSTTISGQLNASTVNPDGQHRANLAWTPNTHQSAAGSTYSQSYEQATTNRLNDVFVQLSNASDRCDFILDELAAAGIVVN
jgi:hypothetical protein